MKLKNILEGGLFADGDWIESKDQDPKGEIRLIQLADIGDGIFIDKSKRFINKDTSIKLRCTFLEEGDILIARMPDPLGRACIFPLKGKNKYVTAVDVCIVRVNDNCYNKYLQYALNTKGIRNKIESQKTGTTRERITRKKLGELEISLPPLEQQKKIAAILDAADELRQKDKALIAKYDELTQALFLDMFGDPVSNPKGWEKKKLKDCTSKIGSGSTPSGGRESYQAQGISLIRSMNVYDNEFYYKDLAHLNNEQAEKLKNVTVEKLDVLFNITGASVCRCTIVPEDVLPARVNQHVSILRPLKNKLNPLYLSHLMISQSTKNQLLRVGSAGGAIMEAITKEQLEKYFIPVPALALQNQFAERVKVIEEQKSIAQASAVKSEELFNSLLQKAFNGELV